MKTLSVFNRRAGAVFATAALVLSTTVPALVSAATVTERSVKHRHQQKAQTPLILLNLPRKLQLQVVGLLTFVQQ